MRAVILYDVQRQQVIVIDHNLGMHEANWYVRDLRRRYKMPAFALDQPRRHQRDADQCLTCVRRAQTILRKAVA